MNEHNMYQSNEDNSLFLENYYELLIERITSFSLSLKEELEDSNNFQYKNRLKDNMQAFRKLISYLPADLTEEVIIETANQVNASSMYISDGYRKLGDYITDTNIPITSPSKISEEIQLLLKNYFNKHQDLDPFTREAIFHMEFIKIHPFEDGNGRTGILLLNYNLVKQGLAPVVITKDLAEYYQECIKNNDIEGMSNLFKMQSKKEKQLIDHIWNDYVQKQETNQSGITK